MCSGRLNQPARYRIAFAKTIPYVWPRNTKPLPQASNMTASASTAPPCQLVHKASIALVAEERRQESAYLTATKETATRATITETGSTAPRIGASKYSLNTRNKLPSKIRRSTYFIEHVALLITSSSAKPANL
jgi:hypothetical protein